MLKFWESILDWITASVVFWLPPFLQEPLVTAYVRRKLRRLLRSWEPKSFREVLREEWWEIRVARTLRRGEPVAALMREDESYTRPDRLAKQEVPETIAGRNLVGLAFSGGGIRSATLNLGVLQGLGKAGLLKKFDYISAVSGGNYIASWLAAWIKRDGVDEVTRQLTPDRAGPPARAEEAEPIRWLREYSNYLTPRLGLLSGDTWSAIATYLRNLLLNQTILILIFCAVLLLPRVLALAAGEIGEEWNDNIRALPPWTPGWLIGFVGRSVGPGHFYFTGAYLLLFIGVWQIHRNMGWFSPEEEPAAEEEPAPAPAPAPAPPKTTRGKILAWLDAKRRSIIAAIAACASAPWRFIRAAAQPTASGAGRVWATVIVPFIAASWGLTVWMWYGPASNSAPEYLQLDGGALRWMGVIAALYTIPWLGATLWGNYAPMIAGERVPGGAVRSLIIPLTALVAGGLGGILLWTIAGIFRRWHPESHSDFSGGLWHAMSWGTPLVLATLTLMAVLHIGLMGIRFQEPKREWWSRLGGGMLTAGLCWMTLFGIGVYGPLLLMWMGGTLATGGFLGWVATTAGGVLGGKAAKSGTEQSSAALEMFLKVAPVIFITGLLLLVSLAAHIAAIEIEEPDAKLSLITRYFERPPATKPAQPGTKICFDCASGGSAVVIQVAPPDRTRLAARTHWSLLNLSTSKKSALELLAAFLAAFLLAWRVDINEFSMHLFYRNRLTRCYLGASRRGREPNPFTGFFAKDDYYLAALSNAPTVQDPLATNQGDMDAAQPNYQGPYPLVNTALNVTTGEKLAWQSRKARSFTFSPRYCGYELLPDERIPAGAAEGASRRLANEGYRETFAYAYSHYFGIGGPLSGTAMGVSGAAASPNMGYHSSPPLAFLMTVFNVRLGLWMGNPRHRRAWTRSGPVLGLPYLVNELAGQATGKSSYVYLSDGGHFENLGIYELVRRRCKYIVACDAGADPEMTLADLGNAIQKCRIDFGVDIEIDIKPLQRKPGTRFSARHHAVGRIRYDLAFPGETEWGTLVYLKASLTEEMPADLLHYMEKNKAFPHTNTGDQFFDETQFESYRELGFASVESAGGLLRRLIGNV